ncbi:MAG: hypothetical protein A2991_02825 [Candidatus Terrybacteria bacterium RIFCSPLOWO2_01_FULL_58_14]|uniref:Uncharacterized protein n=2 Tax=Candidatus Terryibacteriota TaxID=1817920 RepID=A0A1G2Q0R7_9BACT|nr:MAG: hypothetical protein A2682_01405 [Candidatus Terrybacteria bacterium RIFCSPHIGHO2_01_FULL_58_15]OHA54174.1 MAG: hypothetical protein A2991_02825 [Candidatus Terrybacteria bacterium RIFCSPLOWO2_01_FULL_58_14]
MVATENIQGKTLFCCGECGMKYRDREWAEKCEEWCKTHQSCNIEIIAHAVEEKSAFPAREE